MSMMSSYLSGRSGSQSLSVNSSKDRRYNNGNSIALPLLKLDPSGTFILTEATLQWLEEQSSTKGVAILGVSGSGKSFLLNCLAQNPAFRYARGTTSITQGVDMFILPEAEEHDERTILFDVEGSGSRSSEYHAKLLGPMMLIASVIILNFKDRPQITTTLETLSSLAVAAETLNTTKRTLGKVIIVVRDCIDHDDRECRKVKNEIFTITTSQEAEEIRWNEMRRLINDGFSGKEVVLLPPAHDSTREMARPTFGIQHVCEEFSEKINGLRSLIQHASSLCEPGTQQCMTGMFAACALRTAVTSTNRGEGVFPQGAMVNVVAQIISRKTDHCKHQLELLMQAQRQLLTNPDGYEVILRRELTAVKERVFSSISLYRTYPAHAQAVRYIDAYITNLSTAELQRNLQAINAVLERHGQDMNNLLDVIRTSLLTAIAQDYTTVSVAKIQQDFATAINTCLDDIRHVTIPASGLRLTWPIVQRALQGMETKGQDICNLVVQDRNEQELCVLRFREYAARVRSQDPKWSKPNEALENLRDSHHDIHKNIEVGGITFVDRIRGSAEVIDITAVVQDLRTRMATMHTRGSSLVARAEDWGLAISSLAAGSAYLNVGVPEYNGHSLNTLVAWCWNVCKDLDCADEVAIRFVQETSEARKEHPDAGSGDCGQGFAGRFKNALRGFVDVDYQTLDRDTSELFLMAWMHHVVNAKDLTMRERRDKAGEVLDEYKVTGKRLAGYLGYLEEFFAEDA